MRALTLLVLLTTGCAAKSCQRADVDRSSSSSWSFDLEGCTSLKLRGTKIGDAGASALAEALKTNGVLSTLHLGHTDVGAEGAMALAEALGANVALASLHLVGNRIGAEGAAALAEALKNNAVLTSLDLWGDTTIGVEGAKSLAAALETSALTSLHLSGCAIHDEGAKALAQALVVNGGRLTTLDLGHNAIGAEGAAALAEAIRSSDVALSSLLLRGNQICGEGARALAEALKNNHKLTTLNLGSNEIEAAGAKALAAALPTSALTSLHLSGCAIHDEGAKALAQALVANGGALTTLDLGHNAIGVEGAAALAAALMANDVLTSLLLRGNKLRDAGARALAQAFGGLTSLDLGSNAIEAKGAIALIEAHKKNNVLTSLLLKGNSISYSREYSVGVDFETELTDALKAAELGERHSKCETILDKLKATAGETVAAENAAAEKAAASRAAEEQAVVQKAKGLGLYAAFQEHGIAGDTLARAVQWCTEKGADAAEDLRHLKQDEVDQLIESLGLPILKQRKLADKLAETFRADFQRSELAFRCGGGSAVEGGPGGYEAYTKGFNDARAGREFAPIAGAPTFRLEKDEV